MRRGPTTSKLDRLQARVRVQRDAVAAAERRRRLAAFLAKTDQREDRT